MPIITTDFEADCRAQLDRFFSTYHDPVMQARAHKALRLLRTSERPIRGRVEGWAAGIIYAVTNDERTPCGIPGVLNADFELFMGTTMSTVRQRAARVREQYFP